MKQLINIALMAAGLIGSLSAAEYTSYSKWSITVGPLYSVKIPDFGFSSHEAGLGLEGEVFVAENVSLVGSAVSYDTKHSFFDEASASTRYYIPLDGKILALYGEVGALRSFERDQSWNYKIGAGVSANLTKHIQARLGGYIVDDFIKNPEQRYQLSFNYKF